MLDPRRLRRALGYMMTPEQVELYNTSALFRQEVDSLALGFIPTYLRGLEAKARELAADFDERIAAASRELRPLDIGADGWPRSLADPPLFDFRFKPKTTKVEVRVGKPHQSGMTEWDRWFEPKINATGEAVIPIADNPERRCRIQFRYTDENGNETLEEEKDVVPSGLPDRSALMREHDEGPLA